MINKKLMDELIKEIKKEAKKFNPPIIKIPKKYNEYTKYYPGVFIDSGFKG